jgi:hypothetical protein
MSDVGDCVGGKRRVEDHLDARGDQQSAGDFSAPVRLEHLLVARTRRIDGGWCADAESDRQADLIQLVPAEWIVRCGTERLETADRRERLIGAVGPGEESPHLVEILPRVERPAAAILWSTDQNLGTCLLLAGAACLQANTLGPASPKTL